MKRVFANNSEVCHIWAQQTQSEGRAGSIFFEGDSVYSYGYHFKAGQIHTHKGKRFGLVNSRRYSPTTGQHLSHVRDSLDGLMPYFESPNVGDPKAAVQWLDKLAQDSIDDALKRMKVTSRDSIHWRLKVIRGVFAQANELRTFLGRAEKHPSKKQLTEVQAHMDARLKRYRELNTPEMIEKRAREAAKREQVKATALMKAESERIDRFRNGESVSLYNLPFALLRVDGDTVVTSRGARVPLDAARLLFRAVSAGKSVKGLVIGDYTVLGLFPVYNPGMPDDQQIQIGCHKILISEARMALSQPTLRLVGSL